VRDAKSDTGRYALFRVRVNNEEAGLGVVEQRDSNLLLDHRQTIDH